MTAMKVDLDALKVTAKAATLGPWRWLADGSLMGRSSYDPVHEVDIFDANDPTAGWDVDDAAHIAANSPDVTLSIVTRIRELEAALTGAAGMFESRSGHFIKNAEICGYVASIRALVEKGINHE